MLTLSGFPNLYRYGILIDEAVVRFHVEVGKVKVMESRYWLSIDNNQARRQTNSARTKIHTLMVVIHDTTHVLFLDILTMQGHKFAPTLVILIRLSGFEGTRLLTDGDGDAYMQSRIIS
jgi:hypothetical protein